MTSRTLLVALAGQHAESDAGLAVLVARHNETRTNLFVAAHKVSWLAQQARDDLTDEAGRPPLCNSELVLASADLVSQQKVMASVLMDMADLLQRKGVAVEW